MHPEVIGRRTASPCLERLVERMEADGDTWFAPLETSPRTPRRCSRHGSRDARRRHARPRSSGGARAAARPRAGGRDPGDARPLRAPVRGRRRRARRPPRRRRPGARRDPRLGAGLAREIEGIADGAGLPVEHVAALNARTEVLALAAAGGRGECSVAVVLDGEREGPVALQTWDWHEELAGSFHVLCIEHPDGRVVAHPHRVRRRRQARRVEPRSRPAAQHPPPRGRRRRHRRAGPRDRAARARRGGARQPRPPAGRLGQALGELGADADRRRGPGARRHHGRGLPGRPALRPARSRRDPPAHQPLPGAGGRARRPRARGGARLVLRLGVLQRQVRGTSDVAAVRRRPVQPHRRRRRDLLPARSRRRLGARWSTLATIQLDVPGAGLVIRRGGPEEPVAHTTLDAALPVHA